MEPNNPALINQPTNKLASQFKTNLLASKPSNRQNKQANRLAANQTVKLSAKLLQVKPSHFNFPQSVFDHGLQLNSTKGKRRSRLATILMIRLRQQRIGLPHNTTPGTHTL